MTVTTLKPLALPPSAGVLLPALAGGLLCWLPLPALAFLAPELEPTLALLAVSVAMPGWAALLWWSTAAHARRRAQRVGVPLGALAALWFLGPLVAGSPLAFLGGPAVTFVMSAYTGSLYGLAFVTLLLPILAAFGARGRPGDVDARGAVLVPAHAHPAPRPRTIPRP